MADKGPPSTPGPGDYDPLTTFERRMRERILGIDLANIPDPFKQWMTSQLELQPPSIIANQLSGLPAAVNDLLPWNIPINVYMTATANTNFDTLTADSACIGAGMKESSGAQNDGIGWDIMLPAGTWTFELLHMKGTDRGTYAVTFAGSAWGTGSIDGYAIATIRNQRSSLTGLSVTSPTKDRLNLKMSTKNASSSNYKGSIQAIQLLRTA